MPKSGYIAILGRPNVGKSSLLNALLGEKLAAVTPKPQTTRHKILGIKTVPEGQLLFLDTPGIHKPHKILNEQMVGLAYSTLEDADLFILVMEPTDKYLSSEGEIVEKIKGRQKPLLVAINKVDIVVKDLLLPLIARCDNDFHPDVIIPISVLKGDGIQELEREIVKRLPEGPLYFPKDQLTDQTDRFLAAEVIREKAMQLLHEEIPYSLAVIIESYEEPKQGTSKKLTRIKAALIIEKESQKPIVIGKGGSMIKRIGQSAREEIEGRLGQKVFLELFVRVEKEWTKDPNKVREFAYS